MSGKPRAAARAALPSLTLIALLLGLWEWGVAASGVASYVLPAPSAVASAMVEGWGTLWPAWLLTLQVTFLALAAAVAGGVGLAALFALSPLAGRAVYPLAVALQVTPVIALAPLILIYVPDPLIASVLVAFIVAFFPILANTTAGLNGVDPNLVELFRLHGATRWQELRRLRLPAALPGFLAGLRVAGGLALIGAVVAEYVAGSVGASGGLAFRLLEASYRLQTPRVFAAVGLLILSGIAVFAGLGVLSAVLLRHWHGDSLQPGRQNIA